MRTLQSGDGVEKPLSPQCSIRIARLMDGSSVPISTPPTCWADSKAGVVWIRLWECGPALPHGAYIRRCGQHIRTPIPWCHLRQPLAAISTIANHTCSDAAVYGRRKGSSVIHYTPQHLHQRGMQAQHAGGAFMQS